MSFQGTHEPGTRLVHAPGGKSRTKQQFAKDCDITKIMAKWSRAGFHTPPPHVPAGAPIYGDFTSPTDLEFYMTATARAQEYFDALPVAIRDRVDNDPVRFMEWLSNEENREEAAELGIVFDDEAPPVLTPPIVPSPTETPSSQGAEASANDAGEPVGGDPPADGK